MKQEQEKPVGLPENAFRPLKPGEKYHPIMSPDRQYPEVNAWSVTWGILMAILFSAAAAYLGLKVGQYNGIYRALSLRAGETSQY